VAVQVDEVVTLCTCMLETLSLNDTQVTIYTDWDFYRLFNYLQGNVFVVSSHSTLPPVSRLLSTHHLLLFSHIFFLRYYNLWS
jgi:hypothetical protein